MARPPVRRIALLVVALVIAGVCVRLGFWQLHRLAWRRGLNASIEAGLAAAPVPIGSLLGGGEPVQGLAYRQVEATGTYDPSHEVILYGRTQDDRPGNHVLTPLVLADGTAVLVDRGWIPFQANPPLPVPGTGAAPGGSVTVAGYLIAPDDSSPPGAAPVTVIQRIDLTLLSGQMPYRLAPMALLLRSQGPPQTGALPAPAPLPELTEGPHLSYAIQWFAFATIALVGAFLVWRRDRRDERPGAAAQAAAPGLADISSKEGA